MCIIALKPAGIELSDDTIRNMWDNNDDGAGFMFADRGRVKVVKGLMKFNDFMAAYRRVGSHRKMVMHFRIKTHGDISPDLTHPFWISKGNLAMVHNGIISATSHIAERGESDTSLYAKILSHRYPDPRLALRDNAEIQRIESEIGWSKLVFLDGKDNHIIVNEKSGDWVDGCWFSNSSHKSNYRRWSYSSYGNYYSSSYKSVWSANDDTDKEPWPRSVTTTPRSEGYVLGDNEVTKPYKAVSLDADDAEWEALIARYEAKYCGT
jgi:predicted glutamine amidotransferase